MRGAVHQGTENSLRIEATAKLNLYLHVVGRRADGYHLIESLIAFAGVGDVLALSAPRGGVPAMSLSLEGPFGAALAQSPQADNLVLRAGRLLAAWCEEQGMEAPGAMLTLEKNLPVASGIGGGSADAAAALRGLAALWGLTIEESALAQIARQLGADVPACLARRAALMEGIGEQITPLAPLPAMPLLLVNPQVALPTPAVYRRFRETEKIAMSPRAKPVGPWSDTAALIADLRLTGNDLEPAARALCPAIGDVLQALAEAGASLARMSGSGATCFGLFADAQAAGKAATRLAAARPNWWIAESALA